MGSVMFAQWPPRVSRLLAGLVAAVGVVALVGWQFDFASFKAVVPGWSPIAPSTAVLLILVASGLWCAQEARDCAASARPCGQAILRWLSYTGAGAAVLYGILRLAMYATGRDWPLDQLWFSPSAGIVPMVPATALGFVLLGGALLLVTSRRWGRVFQFLALSATLLACLGLSVYCFGGEPLLPFRAMAANTAGSFLLLSAGILAARPDSGLVLLFVSDSAGGVMVRRLLPWALVLPPVLARPRLWGVDAGWFGVEAGTALFTLSNVIAFTALIWSSGNLLHRTDFERRAAERKLLTQIERLALLQQITRAIGERQDLQSIFQAVVRSVEDDLPVDFCCVCLYDRVDQNLTVTGIGMRSQSLGGELILAEQEHIAVDQNGLSRCLRGDLVYEPDIADSPFPFPQRLARSGLRSLVFAPLLVESQVFGVLVAARLDPHSFSSGDCEFLRQLTEHVALAAHQAQLYTALQQAYDDLRLTQESVMQQERLRALGQMASGIAHDINNALSPIALYTESLLETEPALSRRGREQMNTIQRSIDDITQTVARMREFYRQREPQLALTLVDLNVLVQQVVDLTRARWQDMPQSRGVEVEMRTELAHPLPVVMGVEGEIREALTNLVFNAVDALPGGGSITLRTRLAGRAPTGSDGHQADVVQVEVADTGVGMDAETRKRCAEPFFTTKGERGTGLGLAMVYGMTRRHSADIEIESALGVGTTVRLTFAVPAGVIGEAGQSQSTSALPSRLRILIVDDDPILIKSLRDTLEADGHEVISAGGGQAGIDAFRSWRERKRPFAIVITDLGMPHVDGRKVSAAIKAMSSSTPIILLTGWGQRLVAEGDIPPHVDRVLSKPPKLRDLREALAACIPHSVEVHVS
jgi:signal transduction histidine kinase/ActR/RegA family two-component response regulator